MTYYIGITGLPGSGKDAFRGFLEKKLLKLGFDVLHINFTDILKEECAKRNLPLNRESYQQVANDLRRVYGADILAKRIIEKINGRRTTKNVNRAYVLQAIRNPSEVELFRKQLGKTFLLVAVVASTQEIVRRIASRNREDEFPGATDSSRIAEDLLEREIGVGQPQFGLRIGDCIKISDWLIDNSGTLELIEKNVERFIKEKIMVGGRN